MIMGKLVDTMKALAHPTRIQMAVLMRNMGEVQVGQLQELTKVKQSLASQQLTIMRRAGVISARRQGNCVYYKLMPRLTALVDAISEVRDGG